MHSCSNEGGECHSATQIVEEDPRAPLSFSIHFGAFRTRSRTLSSVRNSSPAHLLCDCRAVIDRSYVVNETIEDAKMREVSETEREGIALLARRLALQ